MMKKLLILGLLTVSSAAAGPKVAATLGYGNFSIEDSMRTLHDQVQSLSEMFQH